MNNSVPAAPTLCTVNVIILFDPLATGNPGAAPEGNKKWVAKPTVAIPVFSILTVWLSPSVPPVTSIVTLPVAKTLWSSFDKSKWVVIPDGVIASVVNPTAIPVSPEPSPTKEVAVMIPVLPLRVIPVPTFISPVL